MTTTPKTEPRELRDLATLIRGRRTIGHFLEDPVASEIIDEALGVAVWAPNHHVTQPWTFYRLGPKSIARSVELVRKIVTASKGAEIGEFKAQSWAEKPGWLVVTCQRSDDEVREREDYAACAAAIQNLCLFLWQAGIGTKWVSSAITRDPRFFDILDADPEREFVVGIIWYGYPKVVPEQKRKPLEDVVVDRP